MNRLHAIGSDAIDENAGMLARKEPFWRLLGDIFQALQQDDPISYRYLLLLRFGLVNLVAFALVGTAAGQGWLDLIFGAEGAIYSFVIVVVFVVGLVWSAQRAWRISRALNEIKHFELTSDAAAPAYLRMIENHDAQSRAILASTLRLKLASRLAPIRHLANSLVLLGLVGTVVGFIIALSGVRPDAASYVGTIGPMVTTLINGMSVALHTTLVGSLLHLWLMVNVRMLEGGTIKLLTATVELGERHVRS
jgi:hypothetical protein